MKATCWSIVTLGLAMMTGMAALSQTGCGGPQARGRPQNPADYTRDDVLPFELSIEGKRAVFDDANPMSNLLANAPAAVITDPVDPAGTVEITLPPSVPGKVSAVMLQIVEISPDGKLRGREFSHRCPNNTTVFTLPDKLKPETLYGMRVNVFTTSPQVSGTANLAEAPGVITDAAGNPVSGVAGAGKPPPRTVARIRFQTSTPKPMVASPEANPTTN